MAAYIQFSLESQSMSLVDTLTKKTSEIIWADDVTYIYKRIEGIYGVFGRIKSMPRPASFLAVKVKEIEKFLSLDLERHITLKNAQTPYYVARLASHLDKILTDMSGCVDGDALSDSKAAVKSFSHMAAELQAMANEYGFCKTMDAILEIDEASKKLDALGSRLSSLETQNNNIDPAVAIATMHDVIALKHGIREALTNYNFDRLKSKFDALSQRIVRLENNFSRQNIKTDSQMFMEYLAHQHLLCKPFVDSIIASDTFDTINSDMIHPGTRVWVMETFERWLHNSDKRVFFFAGQHGTGKTAVASAICKLYNYDVIANHFFMTSDGDVLKNEMNGLIQSIASDMCRTIPEYLNWLDDKYGSSDVTAVTTNWRDAYRALIKEPLQDLYGIGKSVNRSLQPRVIIVDAIDEMNRSEWEDFKEFQKLFVQDVAPAFRLFFTLRLKFFSNIVVAIGEQVDGIRLEDKATANRHIKDIEIYLSTSLGAILSGEDELESPTHAKSDEMTLQNTVDELLKCSAGRFDYAIQLMASFAAAFSASGQFLSSVKRATQPVRQNSDADYDRKMSDFASPYRAYRDKEGRSVTVRVMRQSQYPMDKTRVALIRGRHQQHLGS